MNLQAQYQILLSMLAIGIFLGAVFEVYRQCHRRYKFRRIVLHLLDSCFWIMAALLVFYAFYKGASGEIRFYSLCSLAAGVGTHYVVLRKWTIKATDIVIHCLNSIFKGCWWMIMTFLVKPCLLVMKLIKKIWKLLVLVITALVGFVGGMLHWMLQRCGNLFKKRK